MDIVVRRARCVRYRAQYVSGLRLVGGRGRGGVSFMLNSMGCGGPAAALATVFAGGPRGAFTHEGEPDRAFRFQFCIRFSTVGHGLEMHPVS